MLQVGDKVRHKENTDVLGTVQYSTFGLIVSGVSYNEDGSVKHLWQTLGEPQHVVEEYWEKVED